MTRRCVVVQPPSDGVTNCSFRVRSWLTFLKKKIQTIKHTFIFLHGCVFVSRRKLLLLWRKSLFFVYMYYPDPVNVPLLKFLWLKWLAYVAHPAQRDFAENIQKELSFVPNWRQTVIKIHLIIIIIVQSRIFDPCFLKEIFWLNY